MEIETNQSSFGNCWDLIGTQEESVVLAVVGAISNDSNLRIGLNAMQLTNIGYGFGRVFVQLDDEAPTPVEVYNAFGENYQSGSNIWVSLGLAEKLKLRQGDVLEVRRYLDEEGRIRYKCESQEDNPFGQDWGRIGQPADGIVAAIDDDGYNVELYRIGLSAMQMDNLGIVRESGPLNNKTLMMTVMANERGLLDGQDYGNLVVEFEGQRKPAQVYNAFGKRAIGGCGVRVSSILAEDLGLKLEDKVRLYTK